MSKRKFNRLFFVIILLAGYLVKFMFFDPGTLNELIELLTRFQWERLLVRAKLPFFILEMHNPAV